MNRYRILVVDDEPLVATAVSMLLQVDEHKVTIANSGDAALNLFQTFRFDLVLTDLAMPAMTGDQLAAAIKELSPSQPICAVSAYAERLRLSPVPWFDLALEKPVSIPDLRSAVEKLAGGNAPAAAPALS